MFQPANPAESVETPKAGSFAAAPSITLPKGGGAIRGIGEKFAANPVTGTGSMSVPIAVSPGRSGFGPQMSLSYDSGSGNGPFGFGWSLSLPCITRKTDKGLPQYFDAEESDEFILSGAEDLVPVLLPDGTRFKDDTTFPGYIIHRYRPRVEGLFARIERWTERSSGKLFWRSISKDNITTWYGRTGNSCIADPDNSAHVFSWLISASYDDKGNAIVYEYAPEDDAGVDPTLASERNRVRTANRFLKRIKYGNRVPNRDADWKATDPVALKEWMFEAVFDYEEGHYQTFSPPGSDPLYVNARLMPSSPWSMRADPFSSYRAGFEVRTCRLCRRVLMFHHFPKELGTPDYLVRSTDFTYRETPVASFIAGITHSGYRCPDLSQPDQYLKKSLPSVEFEYSQVPDADNLAQQPVAEVDSESLENLPVGLDGAVYQWMDLDGEGTSGILTEQADGWYYKRNLSPNHQTVQDGVERTVVRLGAAEIVARKPAGGLADGAQFLDLAGDGQTDLVQMEGPLRGFYERTDAADWSPFRPFAVFPDVDTRDPNLKFTDLTGDGHADILITEGEALQWHPSLAEEGFGPAVRVSLPLDEENGPRLVFADGAQSVYLADLSGDGLSDLVRIRNGEVCYWPNLGYGHFGGKVTMDHAPRFDSPDQFDQRRIRLADIDGSGTTDILYLRCDGVQFYFNQSGNRWSDAVALPQFPPIDSVASVQALDLLGNGTACLVWSSPLPGDGRRPMRYIALMEEKPHLLVKVKNNLGAETVMQYAPSTKFYLNDKKDGKPWITRLPFPVHVVERVETYDRISRSRFVSRYAYHHGYFDGAEREFRGFGMVEQRDTEEIGTVAPETFAGEDANWDAASFVPPVLTRTWFHIGNWQGRNHVSDFFAGLLDGSDTGEYYREPGLTDAQARKLLLADTILPQGLTAEEEREACRALKGSMLRQEVYALDGTDKQPHPYTVTEQNFTIRVLQPREGNRHAVFFTNASESISYHYERNPADPRIAHTLTLEVDAFGNVLKSAAVGYGRRKPDTTLSLQDQARQSQILITYTESGFTNPVEEDDDYRTPLPYESRTYELTGYTPSGDGGRFRDSDFVCEGIGGMEHTYDTEVGYADQPTAERQRRSIEHVRTLYRRNDLAGALPPGELQSLALPFEGYKLAFTPELLAKIYGGRVTDTMLEDEGRYTHNEGDTNWWIPSGRIFYSPDTADMPPGELACARGHFFLPRRYRNPFHSDAVSTEAFVRYDDYDLLMMETRDALGNRVTAGERDPEGNLTLSGNDYRVLQPWLMMDPNRNRSVVAFDTLGMVVVTAVMGKPPPAPAEGDSLEGCETDLAESVMLGHLADPLADPQVILKRATSRLVYDLFAYRRTQDQPDPQSAIVYTLVRETHDSDPVPAGGLKIRHSFSYSDGFGREIQKKIQAEPGQVPKRDAAGRIILGANGQPEITTGEVAPRWVGSGWTVFNNKGKPVRQYEPFFTDTHRFEFDVRIGVSPVRFYDPVERVVATLHPNHTWEKVVFDPWRQETWDVSDTVLIADPKTDPDSGDFFQRLPEAEYLPSWYAQRQGGALGPQEQSAARKAAVHANSPTVAHADSLGRTFLTVVHNKFKYGDAPPADPPVEEFHSTRVLLDIEGNQREVVDPLDRAVMRYDYDMLGSRIHLAGMEAGERWILNDVAGKPFYSWDSRDHRFRTGYDPLRRPTDSFLSEGAGAELTVERSIYGELRPDPETNNLRGKAVQVFDQAGVVTSDEYDFKGNLLCSKRRLAQAYKVTLDWSAGVSLEDDIFVSRTRYDALNRPTELTTPDGSLIHPSYNEANLLERVEANLRGASAVTPFVTDIDYDAKGQRTLIDYGNTVRTTYEYDPVTYRLTHLLTRRNPSTFTGDSPQPPPVGWPGCQVQNLHYTYDPVGNITHIRDDAQQTVYFRNKRVEPSAEYTYDALYRLIEATGREHLGQVGSTPIPHSWNDQSRAGLLHPNDGNAMGTYLERYIYDSVGNFLEMQHCGSDPANPGWTRTYAYNEASQLEPGKKSNRLSGTTVGATTETYSENGDGYDAHGNMLHMPHLPLMKWDYRDELKATSRQIMNDGETPETTRYVYDSTGQRVRKITELASGSIKDERIYLGGFEIYRRNGVNPVVRETLHIMDDKQRIALVETRTEGEDPAPEQLIRYQFGNHLDSASLEVDNKAEIVSYEEYTPYGSTSYQAVRSQTETPKRYRYTGKERDEESGFYYLGARYYAPWLGRWTAADPAGLVDVLALYSYARGAPMRLTDTSGTFPWPWEKSKPEVLRKELGPIVERVSTQQTQVLKRLAVIALRSISISTEPGSAALAYQMRRMEAASDYAESNLLGKPSAAKDVSKCIATKADIVKKGSYYTADTRAGAPSSPATTPKPPVSTGGPGEAAATPESPLSAGEPAQAPATPKAPVTGASEATAATPETPVRAGEPGEATVPGEGTPETLVGSRARLQITPGAVVSGAVGIGFTAIAVNQILHAKSTKEAIFLGGVAVWGLLFPEQAMCVGITDALLNSTPSKPEGAEGGESAPPDDPYKQQRLGAGGGHP
jgi:RHS repeat-associated protein